jgi:hypothetical protein
MRYKIFIFLLLSFLILAASCDQPNKITEAPDLTVQNDLARIEQETDYLADLMKDYVKRTTFDIDDTIDGSTEIISASQEVQQEAQDIGVSANKVDENADQIKKKTGDTVSQEVTTIKEESESIADSSEKITERTLEIIELSGKIILTSEEQKEMIAQEIKPLNEKLIETSKELSAAGATIKDYEEVMSDLISERDKAIVDAEEALDEKNKDIHNLLKWLIVGCIVGVGIFGVVFLMYGSRFGIVGAAGCALILAISIFVEAYFAYLALIGGVILLGLIGVLIWNVIVQKRAFKEVVDTVEITQDSLSDDAKLKLFGGQGQTGIMDGVQSRETMNMVQKQKNKMSNLWYYAKVNKGSKISEPPTKPKKRTRRKKSTKKN